MSPACCEFPDEYVIHSNTPDGEIRTPNHPLHSQGRKPLQLFGLNESETGEAERDQRWPRWWEQRGMTRLPWQRSCGRDIAVTRVDQASPRKQDAQAKISIAQAVSSTIEFAHLQQRRCGCAGARPSRVAGGRPSIC